MKKAISLFFLLSFTILLKAQIIYMSPEELSKESDYIVEGNVIKVLPEWDIKTKMIYSRITIQVERSYRNKLKDRFVDLVELGGTIGNYSTSAPYNPVYSLNEKVIVFLKYDKMKNNHFTYGALFGKYDVVDNSSQKKIVLKKNRDIDALVIDSKNQTSTIKKIDNISYEYDAFLKILEKN